MNCIVSLPGPEEETLYLLIKPKIIHKGQANPVLTMVSLLSYVETTDGI